MAKFDTYREAFPNARLSRKPNGVLEVVLHTDGGKLVFNGHTHEQFVHLFHSIGEDHHNRVVILTGSGDAFMDGISPEGFDFFSPQGYDKIVPEDRLLARAHEIADAIAALPPLTSRYTRIALTQNLRRIIDEGSGYSLALEGISAADVARAAAQNKRARSA